MKKISVCILFHAFLMVMPASLTFGAGNLRKGSTELRLYEAITYTYNDNIFLTDGNYNRKAGDTIITFSPGIEVANKKNNNVLLFSYNADILNYQDYSSENRETQRARFFMDSKFGGDFLLKLQYDYMDVADPASSELTSFDERTQNTFFTSLGANFSDNMTFKLNYQETGHDYDKLSLSNLDRTSQLAGCELSILFLPKTSFILEYNHTSIEYDTVVKNDIKDSEANSILLGLRGSITSKSYINAMAGYSSKKYDQPGKQGFNGLTVGLTLLNRYSKFTKFSVAARREVVESFYLNNNFYIDNRISLKVDHAINHKISTSLGGSYAVNDYNMTSTDVDGSNKERADELIGIDINLSYKIQPWFSTGIQYTFKERDSNFAAEDYNNNQLLFTIKAEI